MKRRAFIAALGGAAAWPVVGRAQQIPVVGYISAGEDREDVAEFRRGLKETGYTEGRNVKIELRKWDGKLDDLPELVAELIALKVSVIVCLTSGALAAKAATATIPILFATGGDPVEQGLVDSLSRPGGNLTGVTFSSTLLLPKRLGLLHEMVPQASLIGVLLKRDGFGAEVQFTEANEAAHRLGLDLHAQRVSSENHFEDAFSAFVQARAGALLVGADPFFFNQREALITQAAQHRLPAIYTALGNMRAQGVRNLIAFGHNDACRHQAIIDVSSCPRNKRVPWFRSRVGGRPGRHIDCCFSADGKRQGSER
jgi:putative ABC transport system substrate-binding protein